MSVLTIVQGGGAKIWKKSPHLGSVPAEDAYTSPYFRKQCRLASRTSDRQELTLDFTDGVMTEETIERDNVGRTALRRGRRIMQFALKYMF